MADPPLCVICQQVYDPLEVPKCSGGSSQNNKELSQHVHCITYMLQCVIVVVFAVFLGLLVRRIFYHLYLLEKDRAVFLALPPIKEPAFKIISVGFLEADPKILPQS